MKAFFFDRPGGPEVLRFEDVPLPEPGKGEVRIRHTAVALNFRDILVRRGQHAVKSFPSGLGTESAGVVEAVGEGVTDLAAGDLVATVCRPDCAYAEARIAPAALSSLGYFASHSSAVFSAPSKSRKNACTRNFPSNARRRLSSSSLSVLSAAL